MSYKYEEVVVLIKQSKKENFKTPIWLWVCMAFGIAGGCLLGAGSFVGYQDSCGVCLSVIGFTLVLITVICFLILSHQHQSKAQKEIDDLLTNIKDGLHCIGIKTKEDIITLQSEVQKSIEQSDRHWAKALSTIKWAFCLFCVTPIGFALSARLKPIFENDSFSLTLWCELIIKLAFIGVLATTIAVTLAQLADSMRKSFGPYKQKCEVYHRLEDMKYLYSK